MTTDEIAAAIEANMPGVTPGEWKAVSDPHFDSGLVYTSVQPVVVDEDAMKPLAMANGEYHVCLMSHTAAAWRFGLHRINANHIALCNPANITALLAERKVMREALEIIAGKRQCLDNLMSNGDVARAALKETDHG